MQPSEPQTQVTVATELDDRGSMISYQKCMDIARDGSKVISILVLILGRHAASSNWCVGGFVEVFQYEQAQRLQVGSLSANFHG